MYAPAADGFDDLAYGAPHPGTLQYMQQKFETLSTNLSEMGRAFMADARQKWDSLMGSEAMRRARAVKRKLEGALFMRDEVVPMYDLPQLQSAPPVMQRWIMACPEVRDFYHAQRIDGYSTSYVDPFPGQTRDDDYNYRRVMTGVVVDDGDGGWKSRTYLDDLEEGDLPLGLDQKADILHTWDAVRAILAIGREDPTSQSGGWL
jgi:hypothetical protein